MIRTGMRQSDEDRNGIHGDEALVGAGPQTGAPIDRSKKSLIIILLSIYTESGGVNTVTEIQTKTVKKWGLDMNESCMQLRQVGYVKVDWTSKVLARTRK